MASVDPKVNIVGTANMKGVADEFKRVGKSADTLGSSLDAQASRMHNVAVKTRAAKSRQTELIKKQSELEASTLKLGKGALGALAVGLGAVTVAAGKFIALSNQQEDAVNKLEAALRSTSQLTPELSAEYQALASSFQEVTRHGDEKLLPLMARLVSVGGVTRDRMSEMTQASLDLAAGLGKDAAIGFDLMAKAATGNTETLGRYGITITEGLGPQEKLAELLKIINERFGGQAAAQAETYAGAMEQAGNRLGDAGEKAGAAIKEMLPLPELLGAGADVANVLAENMGVVTIGVGTMGVALLAGAASAGVFAGAMAAMSAATAAATTMLMGPAGIVLALGALAVGAKLAYDEIDALAEAQERLTETQKLNRPVLEEIASEAGHTAEEFAAMGITLENVRHISSDTYPEIAAALERVTKRRKNEKDAIVASTEAEKAHAEALSGETAAQDKAAEALRKRTEELLKAAGVVAPEEIRLRAEALTAAFDATIERTGNAQFAVEKFGAQIEALRAQATGLREGLPPAFLQTAEAVDSTTAAMEAAKKEAEELADKNNKLAESANNAAGATTNQTNAEQKQNEQRQQNQQQQQQ